MNPSNPSETKRLPSLGEILAEFWPHLKPQRLRIAAALSALFLEVVLRLLEPWPLKFVFDALLERTGTGRWLFPNQQGLSPGLLAGLAALAVVLVSGFRAVASYWSTLGFARIGNTALAAVRADLFRRLQSLPLSYHAGHRGGDLVLRVVSDASMLQDVAVTALLPLMARMLVLVGMVGVMFWMRWELALVAIAVAPLFWWRTQSLSRGIQESARQQRKREGAMAAAVSESLGAVKVVQALALESVFGRTFSSQSDKSQKQDLKGKRLTAGLERSVDVLIAISTALVLWLGAQLVLSGKLTAGDLLVFLSYLKSAYRPLQDFAKYTGRLGKASAAAGRVLEILHRAPAVVDRPDARSAEGIRGLLEFEGVSFGYPSGRVLIQDLSFRVGRGQTVAILGESGSGKSSLLGLVPRLFEPLKGQIRIDHLDVRDYTVESLRRQISMVLQENAMFSGTIRENITFGLGDVPDSAVEAAARLANAHEFICAQPEGYDTTIGERGVKLSQGQRQRLAIARAALRPSSLLLLDEPTTGLDEANEAAVVDALGRLARQRTTLWVTHNPRHAELADVVIRLTGDGGVMLEHRADLRAPRSVESPESPNIRWAGPVKSSTLEASHVGSC